MSDANAAEEKVKETVRRTNGELGREQLNYWQCYQKTLRHVAHRIGLGFKQELFHRALAILTAPPAES
jgi:hypothetical protein